MVFDGPLLGERLASVRAISSLPTGPTLHPVLPRIIEKAARYSAADSIRSATSPRGLRPRLTHSSQVDVLVTPTFPWNYHDRRG